jgi:hypothetical protein
MHFLGTFMQVCLPKVWAHVCTPKAPRRAQFEKKMTQIFRALVNNFFSGVQKKIMTQKSCLDSHARV